MLQVDELVPRVLHGERLDLVAAEAREGRGLDADRCTDRLQGEGDRRRLRLRSGGRDLDRIVIGVERRADRLERHDDVHLAGRVPVRGGHGAARRIDAVARARRRDRERHQAPGVVGDRDRPRCPACRRAVDFAKVQQHGVHGDVLVHPRALEGELRERAAGRRLRSGLEGGGDLRPRWTRDEHRSHVRLRARVEDEGAAREARREVGPAAPHSLEADHVDLLGPRVLELHDLRGRVGVFPDLAEVDEGGGEGERAAAHGHHHRQLRDALADARDDLSAIGPCGRCRHAQIDDQHLLRGERALQRRRAGVTRVTERKRGALGDLELVGRVRVRLVRERDVARLSAAGAGGRDRDALGGDADPVPRLHAAVGTTRIAAVRGIGVLDARDAGARDESEQCSRPEDRKATILAHAPPD